MESGKEITENFDFSKADEISMYFEYEYLTSKRMYKVIYENKEYIFEHAVNPFTGIVGNILNTLKSIDGKIVDRHIDFKVIQNIHTEYEKRRK